MRTMFLLRPVMFVALFFAMTDQLSLFFGFVQFGFEEAPTLSTGSLKSRSSILSPGYYNANSSQVDHNVTTTQSPGRTNSSNSVPSNLHIAFMGDSVTRFQYVSLVHYLHTHQWVQETDRPNILSNKGLHHWLDFYNVSSSLVQDKCDCHRGPGKINLDRSFENRYYSDTANNNHVAFIRKMGRAETHGHWDPSTAFSIERAATDIQTNSSMMYQWQHASWADSIRQHVAKLSPKPDYLVFNAGLWKGHDLGDPVVLRAIREALDQTGIRGIYQTTTRR